MLESTQLGIDADGLLSYKTNVFTHKQAMKCGTAGDIQKWHTTF